MSRDRPALRALADRLGIVPSYRDVGGRERATSDASAEALALAMGFDASGEASAARALAALDAERAGRLVDPVLVWREWEHADPELEVEAALLAGARDFALELRLEDGRVLRREGRLPGAAPGRRVGLALPARPPPGYHEVRLALDGGSGGARAAVQQLVMTPRTAFAPEEATGRARAFGVLCNLYTLRSPRGFGHGTFGDLAELARWAAGQGAAFVGLNPLHAVENRGLAFAPYSPSSRLFRNLLYLDPEAVPELAESTELAARLADPAVAARRAALLSAPRLDHEAIHDAVLPLLRELHRVFRERHAERATPRGAAWRAYCEREGDALRDFATWEALAEAQGGGPGGFDPEWWRWPPALRDSRSSAVEAFRSRCAEAVDFRRWLQFELDRQLGVAAAAARDAGCRLGVYGDLALGSSRASADTWMAQDLYARGVNVGAPPDDYAPAGQDWGFPPFDPHRLRASGYREWIRLLRASFAHAGALRLDHAIGLLRLFWIPAGRPGSEGAYVRYRGDELLGILALESRRHRAIVVAEDLGTVPPELPGLLHDWGLLRSAVLRFERDADGSFRPPRAWPARSLATAGTHDLPPLAGFWTGADVSLRRALGAAPPDADAAREAERRALLGRLRAENLLPGEGDPDPAALMAAVHGLLARTPAALIGVSLDDLAGETEPVNLPGVPLETHRSWSRRMARPLAELTRAADVAAALEPLRELGGD
jgi:4-alpha-glucanotransferase